MQSVLMLPFSLFLTAVMSAMLKGLNEVRNYQVGVYVELQKFG
jgi:hypothetical protein